jgi:hypothetical protein
VRARLRAWTHAWVLARGDAARQRQACAGCRLQVLIFLNRLSDYLFTAARFAVSGGAGRGRGSGPAGPTAPGRAARAARAHAVPRHTLPHVPCPSMQAMQEGREETTYKKAA